MPVTSPRLDRIVNVRSIVFREFSIIVTIAIVVQY